MVLNTAIFLNNPTSIWGHPLVPFLLYGAGGGARGRPCSCRVPGPPGGLHGVQRAQGGQGRGALPGGQGPLLHGAEQQEGEGEVDVSK